MAYQNVRGTRFYVSALLWLKALGKMEGDPWGFPISGKSREDLLDINPSTQATFSPNGNGSQDAFCSYGFDVNFSDIMPNKDNFFMALGHDFKDVAAWGCRTSALSDNDYVCVFMNDSFVNYHSGLASQRNGFSIGAGNDAHDVTNNRIQIYFETYDEDRTYKLGSFLYGTYYDVPHSPDLKLTMSREMDGVKKIRTKGGHDLVKHQYTKPPLWGNAAPWELYDDDPDPGYQNFARSGRRIWSLSFSYLQDKDVFPDTSSLSNFGVEGYSSSNSGTEYSNTLLNEESFYSQVIHKTNGGQLPFVFQPDNSNINIDGFAICKFDMNSFEFDQVANGVYNVKCKIREVW